MKGEKMFFICAIERRKKEKTKDFLVRVFKFKKMVEKELRCKLKIVVYVDDQQISWAKILNTRQKHPNPNLLKQK